MKVIDAHAHLELPIPGVTTNPERKRQPMGLMWEFELMKFNPVLWPLNGLEPSRTLISVENQLETSFQSAGRVRKALGTIGKRRVMFGSDWPESNQKTALSIARKVAGFDKDLLDNLLWRNIEELVG